MKKTLIGLIATLGICSSITGCETANLDCWRAFDKYALHQSSDKNNLSNLSYQEDKLSKLYEDKENNKDKIDYKAQ